MLIFGVRELLSARRVRPHAPEIFVEWFFDHHPTALLRSDSVAAPVLERITTATRSNRALQIQAVASLRETLAGHTFSFSGDPTEPLTLTKPGVELHRFTRKLVSTRPGGNTASDVGAITWWAARRPDGPWRIVLHNAECLPWAFSTITIDLRGAPAQFGFCRAPRFWAEIEASSRRQPLLLLTCKQTSAEVLRRFDENLAPWLGPTLARRRVVTYVGQTGGSLLPTDLGKRLKERGGPQVGFVVLRDGEIHFSAEIDWTKRAGREVMAAIEEALGPLDEHRILAGKA
jgi:hypothetical protein